jgi:hypothetical protein
MHFYGVLLFTLTHGSGRVFQSGLVVPLAE